MLWSLLESAPIQFFITHIGDLLSISLKLIPIWATYKGLMAANTLITATWGWSLQGLKLVMAETAAATDGAAEAAELFNVSWSATGIGAIAVALGLVVEHLMSMNEELNKAIDKKFKLSESNDFYKTQSEKYNSIKERMGLLNDHNFGLKEKQELYSDIQNYLHSNRLKIPELAARESAIKKSANSLPDPNGLQRLLNGINPMVMTGPSSLNITEIGAKTHEQLKEFGKNFDDLAHTIPDVKNALKEIATSQGFKPPKGYKPGGSIQDNASDTSALGGPKGGLGEAKVINFVFHDALQKVTVTNGKDIVAAGQDAVEFIIRALQNFSYSQSSSQ